MTTLQLIAAVNQKAQAVKKDLTKSFFNGDKNYFFQMLNKYPNANVNGNIYETINNIASAYARSLEY
jgi:hypothetical protein